MLDAVGRDRLLRFGAGGRDWRLVALSVIEQRYRTVMAVLDGAGVTEVAAEVGVSRQSVHSWVARYRAGGLAGLTDRSRRPRLSPNRASAEVEARVCELRRAHPSVYAHLHPRFRPLARAFFEPGRGCVARAGWS